jgi:hypothetical protein
MGEDIHEISSYALGLAVSQCYSLDTGVGLRRHAELQLFSEGKTRTKVEEPKELSKLYWARSESSRTTLSVEGGTFTES